MSKTNIRSFAEKIRIKNDALRETLKDCNNLKEEFLDETKLSKISDVDRNTLIYLIDNSDKYNFGDLVDKMDKKNLVFRKPLSEIIESLGIPNEEEGKEFMLGLLRLTLLETTFSKEST